MPDSTQRLASFLTGETSDASDRHIVDVLSWDDAQLEASHDYIQWLFPLLVASSAVPSAPILSRKEIQTIRESDAAQASLRRAAERMLAFYRATDVWLVWHDHNHLRITRIIRSLWLLVGPEAADEFLDEIMFLVAKAGRPVSAKSIKFWHDAAGIRAD